MYLYICFLKYLLEQQYNNNNMIPSINDSNANQSPCKPESNEMPLHDLFDIL